MWSSKPLKTEKATGTRWNAYNAAEQQEAPMSVLSAALMRGRLSLQSFRNHAYNGFNANNRSKRLTKGPDMARVNGKKNEIKRLKKQLSNLESQRSFYPQLSDHQVETHERRISTYAQLLKEAEAA